MSGNVELQSLAMKLLIDPIWGNVLLMKVIFPGKLWWRSAADIHFRFTWFTFPETTSPPGIFCV